MSSASMKLLFAITILTCSGIPVLTSPSPASHFALAGEPGSMAERRSQSNMKVAAAPPITSGLGNTLPAPTPVEAAGIQALEPFLPRGGRALCVGCKEKSSTCYMAAAFASRVGVGGSVKTIEIKPEFASETRSYFELRLPASLQRVLEVVDGDGACLAREGKLGSDFDAIFVGGGMNKVPQALCKSIKPGGALLITVTEPFPQLILVKKPIGNSIHSSLTHEVVWGSNERDRRDREAELAWGHSGLADLLKQAHASSIPDLENDWERIKGREDAEGTDTKDGNVVVSSKEGRLECESVEGVEGAGEWKEVKEDSPDQEIVRLALKQWKNDRWRDDFWHDVVWREDGTVGYDAAKDEDSSLGDEPPWQRPIWTVVTEASDDALRRLCNRKKTIKAEDVYRARKKRLKALRSRAGSAIIGQDVKLLPLSRVHIDKIALILNSPEARRSVIGHEITRGILDKGWYQLWGDRVFASVRECWLTVTSDKGSNEVFGLVGLRFGPKCTSDPTIVRITIIIDEKRRMQGKATQALALAINFAFHHLGARKFVACFETGDEGSTTLCEKLLFERRGVNQDIDRAMKNGSNCALVDEWRLSATEEWVDSILEKLPLSKRII